MAHTPTTSLDIERPAELLSYLRSSGRIAADETPAIRVLAGGVSNRTVLVERAGGEAWVLKQALAKLRVQVDWFSDPARVQREAQGLIALTRLAPPGSITPLIFEDHQHHLLAMAAVPQPHENWKTLLLAGRIDAEHVRQFARLLGCVHRRSAQNLPELAVFADRGFFESLRLEPYYGYSAETVPAAAGFLRKLSADTRQRTLTLVHGDYSPKNVLIHQERVVLLDHEVIHLGDPAFDVGFALTHLLSKAHHMPGQREALTQAAGLFWTSYRQELGAVPFQADLEAYAIAHTLGCLLARVAGRSPLEYLDARARLKQQRAVLDLLAAPPPSIRQLISAFVQRL